MWLVIMTNLFASHILRAMMLLSGFSCPSTRPVISAGMISEISTGVGTAPMPLIIEFHSATGTARNFLPAMSFGDFTG